MDYIPLNLTLTFNSATPSIEVNATLINDASVEGNEDFLAVLEILTGGNGVLLADDDEIVTIIDDDRELFSFCYRFLPYVDTTHAHT